MLLRAGVGPRRRASTTWLPRAELAFRTPDRLFGAGEVRLLKTRLSVRPLTLVVFALWAFNTLFNDRWLIPDINLFMSLFIFVLFQVPLEFLSVFIIIYTLFFYTHAALVHSDGPTHHGNPGLGNHQFTLVYPRQTSLANHATLLITI